MTDIIEFFSHIIDPAWILSGGIYLLLFIIFAETGLFIGFFLPGDSLLFIAGIYVNKLQTTLWQTIHLVSLAAIIGNVIGYLTGTKTGNFLFKRKKSFLFNPQRLEQSKAFFKKYGALAIMIARFLPIVRTFVPIVAGIAKMNFKKFMIYNILGAYVWVASLILAGYYLNKKVPWIQEKLLIIILLIIAITLLPTLGSVCFKLIKSCNNKKIK